MRYTPRDALPRQPSTGDHSVQVSMHFFRGFNSIIINQYITTDLKNISRNNGSKIIGKYFRSNEAKHFFFNRIMNISNIHDFIKEFQI